MVKILPVVEKNQFQSLGHEDPLEKGMATHSRILAWGTPWTAEPGRLQSMGPKKLDMTATNTFTFTFSPAGVLSEPN